MVSTVEEALAHCPGSSPNVEGAADAKSSIGGRCTGDEAGAVPDAQGSKKSTGNGTGGADAASSAAQASGPADKESLPNGEVIAYDGQGRPSIVRAVDEQTGVARTIVRNEDGTKRIFGQSTVASLASSDMDKSKKWAEALTSHQLRGLVHEVGQRLLDGSRLYHSRLSDLEKAGERLNFMYFNLNPEASERDVDKAYRRMAQKMHPDKNGGTDDAKTKFQHMKERYESLKKKWSPPEDPLADEEEEAAADSSQKEAEETKNQDEANAETEGEKTAEDEEGSKDSGEEQKKGKGVSISYDPKDKEQMVKTVTKMVKQLKNIDMQMEVLVKELRRAQSQLPPEEGSSAS